MSLQELTNYIDDDFEDSVLTGRVSASTGYFKELGVSETGQLLKGINRPEWILTQSQGGTDVIADTGRLVLVGDGTLNDRSVKTPANMTVGELEYEVKDNASTNGSMAVSCFGTGRGRFFVGSGYSTYLNVGSAGSFYYYRRDAGSGTIIIDAGTWTNDNNRHIINATFNEYGEHEMFEDSVSAGTATDSTYRTSEQTVLGANAEQNVEIFYIQYKPLP